MIISFSSLLNITVFSSLIMFITLAAMNTKKFANNTYSIKGLLICVIIILIRMFFPFEMVFTKTILIPIILPNITVFMHSELLNIGKIEIYVYHLLLIIWGIGIIYRSIIFLSGYIKVLKTVNDSLVFHDFYIYKLLDNEISKRRKANRFRIAILPANTTPFIVGFINPIIALPDSNLTAEEILNIVLHEVTHYYKGDIWLGLFLELLCILYWWNPLVYRLKKRTLRILETHTDICVVKSMNESERCGYVKSIIKIARTRELVHSNFSINYVGNCDELNLERRFEMVLEYNDNHKFSFEALKPILINFILVMVLSCFSFAIIFEAHHIPAEIEKHTFTVKVDNSYLVEATNGGYNLYIDNEFISSVQEIDKALEHLHIYKNLEEIENNEKN